jgi:hypothetical protein
MSLTTFNGDFHFNGALSAKTFSPPASSVGNNAIAANAGIAATKLQHRHEKTYSQPNTTTTAETRILHVVKGANATVQNFRAGSIAPAIGGATVTVDLKKNGSSILTSVITLDNANVAYVVEEAAITAQPGRRRRSQHCHHGHGRRRHDTDRILRRCGD